VNAEAFAGFTDWRVATRDELAGILLAVCPGGGTPCIDPIFGPTASSNYWSATENDPTNALIVDFVDGDVLIVPKDLPHRVRAVRSGPYPLPPCGGRPGWGVSPRGEDLPRGLSPKGRDGGYNAVHRAKAESASDRG